jgi:hypothetical protein
MLTKRIKETRKGIGQRVGESGEVQDFLFGEIGGKCERRLSVK